MEVVSCYPRGAAGGTSRPGGVLWMLGEALAAPTFVAAAGAGAVSVLGSHAALSTLPCPLLPARRPVLPDTDQSAQQAVATVESLEARAQAHAEITAAAVAQAREMQEAAAAHAQEQAKAIAQATMLQVQAQTLQVRAGQGGAARAELQEGSRWGDGGGRWWKVLWRLPCIL